MNKCHFLYHKAGKVTMKLNQDLIIISNNITILINHMASDTKLGRACMVSKLLINILLYF